MKSIQYLTACSLAVIASLVLFSFTVGEREVTASGSFLQDTTSKKKIKELDPKGKAPEWAKGIKGNMHVVIEKLASFNAKPIEKLTPQQARKNPTPKDAVMAVMKDNKIAMPKSIVDTSGISIPVKEASLKARVYKPKSDGPLPLIVYYHGGGWVIADIDTYDASAKGLAEQARAIVVSVHYRQAPEHKFPTAHNDAFAAYQWIVDHAQELGADGNRIAVVGESAGGNLAANVSIMARDKNIREPLHQILVYPIASNDMNSESYQENANAKPLNKAMMKWFMSHYAPSEKASADPRIVLVKAKLNDLPPTTIITAELDPLLSDGELLRDKLKAAGVDVDYKEYNGVTHEFFGMAAVVPEAAEAQAYAARQLRNAFEVSAKR